MQPHTDTCGRPGSEKAHNSTAGSFLGAPELPMSMWSPTGDPPSGCYMTAPPKVPVSVPTEAHSAHRGTYQSRDPPPRTAASCYLYGVACLQNACRKMRGGAPSTTAGSTPVPRPPLGVLWAGSNRPWRARVAIYHPRRAAPPRGLGRAWAAVTWNFTYITDGAGKAVFRQKRKKRCLAEKPPKTLTLHTKYMPTRPYKGRGA